MYLDVEAVYAGQITSADLMRDVRPADLYRMTDDLFAALESILSTATDAAEGEGWSFTPSRLVLRRWEGRSTS